MYCNTMQPIPPAIPPIPVTVAMAVLGNISPTVENILADHDDKYYGQRDGMELHLLVYIDFEETVFYETYDFIPVGTRFTLLNEDTMLVEFWGKTLLARRVA